MAEIELIDTGEKLQFSQHLACVYDGLSFEELAPRSFSFNSPYGACPTCVGLGTRYEVDPDLVVPNDDLSLANGALAPWAAARTEYFSRIVRAVSEEIGFRPRRSMVKVEGRRTKDPALRLGNGRSFAVSYRNRYGTRRSYQRAVRGRDPHGSRAVTQEAESDFQREQVEGYMREVPCTAVRRRASASPNHSP